MVNLHDILEKITHGVDLSSLSVDDLHNLLEASGIELADISDIDLESFLNSGIDDDNLMLHDFQNDDTFDLVSSSKQVGETLKTKIENIANLENVSPIEKSNFLYSAIENASHSLYGDPEFPNEMEYIGLRIPNVLRDLLPSEQSEFVENFLKMTNYNLKSLSFQISNSMPKDLYCHAVLTDESMKEEYDKKIEEILKSLLVILGTKNK